MKKRRKVAKVVVVAASVIIAVVIGLYVMTANGQTVVRFKSEAGVGAAFSYTDYAAVLKTFVDKEGFVGYKGLKADRQRLDRFCASLGRLDRKTYETWKEAEKIAFWINAYNALTLAVIVEHYPIRRSIGITYLAYPASSIRQISGVWDKVRFIVMGEKMTLDHIEHAILRKEFHEPRIHVALVCAAMGCPPLRNEPYVGARLDSQLDDQARKFLRNPKKFGIDRAKGRVYLSNILKWFGGDFIAKYGTDKAFRDFDTRERAVLSFIAGHLDAKDGKFLREQSYKIEYLDYDWSLNERKAG